MQFWAIFHFWKLKNIEKFFHNSFAGRGKIDFFGRIFTYAYFTTAPCGVLAQTEWSDIFRAGPTTTAAELQRIIRIIRYLNSWDRIVLFVFGIRSICNFRIVFEYPNSCYRIPNSYRLFIKQNVYQKYRKKLHKATKTKNQILLFSCCLKFNLWKKY